MMTDDIVTRLRIACRSKGAEYCGNCQPCDAANEIERLRAEVAYLKTPCPRCDYEDEY